MGTNVTLLRKTFQKCFGANPAPKRYLDIGAQNLYGGTAEDYVEFIAYCLGKDAVTEPIVKTCSDLADRSIGTIQNQTTCAELFELVGWEYVSIDMVEFATIKGDLNTYQVEARHFGYFDCVANFGTTEHIFNQLNCFWNIHYATKVGGFIVHMVPASGFYYHCLFSYNPKVFLLMAEANRYQVLHAAIYPQGTTSEIDSRHVSWAEYERRAQATSHDVLVEFVFRRMEATDFRFPYDLIGTDLQIRQIFIPACTPIR
jgi:hypothetical protein